jgi:hypothetical protein
MSKQSIKIICSFLNSSDLKGLDFINTVKIMK